MQAVSFSDIFVARLPSLAALSIKRRGIPLRLKLEYDGNNYQNDFAGKLSQASHFNVGAVYRAASWADLNLSYERGNTLMFVSLYGPISTICALPCAIRQNRHINLRLNLKDCSTPRSQTNLPP
ncbi:YjbH domain-containing protein [Escherichia coli]